MCNGGTVMSGKLNEQNLHEVIERRSTGKTSYSEFLQELSSIGVIHYDTDVATGQVTYFGENSELKTDTQVDFTISESFNRSQAMQAISNLTLPFLDCLRELANAGIRSYTINLKEKQAVYTGTKAEQIIEPLSF
jgi:uncharacterized protein YbcV (DUF1398 family)